MRSPDLNVLRPRATIPRFDLSLWGNHRDIASMGGLMVKVLLVLLCFILPFLAVLIKDGPSLKVLWAFLLQLCGHIPGVIYGIYQVVKD